MFKQGLARLQGLFTALTTWAVLAQIFKDLCTACVIGAAGVFYAGGPHAVAAGWLLLLLAVLLFFIVIVVRKFVREER